MEKDLIDKIDGILEEALRKPQTLDKSTEFVESDDMKPVDPVSLMDIPPNGLEDFG